MSATSIEKSDGVVFIWLDQEGEKVNKIGVGLIDEFGKVMDTISGDPEVKAVVIISRKKDNFIAGADLDKFLAITEPGEAESISRRGHALLDQIANFPKPVVAAINGAALGGGLEVALACHYRIATDDPKTVLALPEVNLGILPAGGGTQRLPRLVGLRNALDILLTGKNIYPRQAQKMGLVDMVTYPYRLDDIAKSTALKLADKSISQSKSVPVIDKILQSTSPTQDLVFKKARDDVQHKTRGNYPAPFKIIECVEAGLKGDLAAGEEAEASRFDELVRTPQAKELIRLFFNMNSKKKNPLKENARPVEKIGILGAGFMGSAIANVSAEKEFEIFMRDMDHRALGMGKKSVWQNLDRKVKKHALLPHQRDLIMSRIHGVVDYTGFSNVDLVIEAVFEDLKVKKNVLAEAESKIKEETIYASNTSSLPISKIAEASSRREQVIGMHYFSPVTKMPLLEIIVTGDTPEWVKATAIEVGIRQGKSPIVVNDGPGFYTTRILGPMLNEAVVLLEEGGEIGQIDNAMRQYGFPVGPIALIDEVGIDVGAHVSDVLGEMFEERNIQSSDAMKRLDQAGFKGRKNRKGFYRYPEGKNGHAGKKEINDTVYNYFGGESRQKFDVPHIQDRLSLVMINEAAFCLQEGILQSPADGDLGAILGLGFPPFLGGPFRYIDKTGAGAIADKLQALEQKYGPRFKPADILTEYAQKEKRFYPD